MKVLMITFACDRDDVSEPRTSYTWVNEISKDHDVTVLSCSKRDRFGCVKEQFPNLKVIEWQDIWFPEKLERFRATVKPGYFFYYIKARRYLRKLLETEKFDVIHQLSPFAWRYPSPAAGLGVPVIRGPVAGGLPTPEKLINTQEKTKGLLRWLRKSDVIRKKYDPVLRKSYRELDLLMVAAPYVQDLIPPLQPKQMLLEAEHGYNEAPELNHTNARPPNDKVKLLFVGRAVRWKGLRDTIRALAHVTCREKIELTIIGAGEDLEACKTEAEKLGVNEITNFIGWGSKETVAEHYRTSDIFICPTFREPVGVVFLEAMSYGLPTICCAYGGPDFLIDQNSGIKVKPDTEEKFAANLAKAIDKLVTDSDLRSKLAKGAKQRALDNFEWKAKRKRITEIYGQIAEKQK